MVPLFTLSYDVGIGECFVKLNSNYPGKKAQSHVSHEINGGIYVTQHVNTFFSLLVGFP